MKLLSAQNNEKNPIIICEHHIFEKCLKIFLKTRSLLAANYTIFILKYFHTSVFCHFSV